MNWIKLSEKLPEDTVNCLVYIQEQRQYWVREQLSKTEIRLYKKVACYNHCEVALFCFKEDWESKSITHWCEIEEPKEL